MNRMVVAALLSPISIQGNVNNVAGLGSYITSFFGMTAAPQEHTSNKAWSEPINGDAKGMFQVYYQNVHGIPCDDVTLAQDLQALAEYDVGCLCLSETNLDLHRPYV
jgi:hypothetical protein